MNRLLNGLSIFLILVAGCKSENIDKFILNPPMKKVLNQHANLTLDRTPYGNLCNLPHP